MRAEQDFEDLFQRAPCGYLSPSPDGVIVKANSTFGSCTGFEPAQLAGTRVRDLFKIGGKIYLETQLLPLFWALDTLQYDRKDGDRYPPVKIQTLSQTQATSELRDAMDQFSTEKAETAIVSLARSSSPKAAMSELWQYASGDDTEDCIAEVGRPWVCVAGGGADAGIAW